MIGRQSLLLRLFVWCEARSLPVRLRNRPLVDVLRIADSPPFIDLSGVPQHDLLNLVVRTTRRPWTMRHRRCLRQGVLGYRLLRAAGETPELVFGVDPSSIEAPIVRAHCWVVSRGEVVLNPPEPGLVTVLRHTSRS
ncbi:lasso peptide biosynthesis B2 protein [Terrihabitans rhizophilus]|uniref:lasso peptide biosynthesis B2 protein n=1 Tax=Terrihabitans rhizophilus TaxID=3092662 RepID=UPI003CC63930